MWPTKTSADEERYPSASPSISLDQRVETFPKRPNAFWWIHDSRFSDISHFCSKSAQASRSTFAPAEGSTTDLTHHISVILVQLQRNCEIESAESAWQECPLSNPGPARKKQTFFSPRSGSFSFTGRPRFAMKENRKQSHVEAACRIIQ